MNAAVVEQFAAGARRAASFGLMLCSSGNLSWRVDDGNVLITATRSWLCELRTDQVALCRFSDGAHLAGPRPSVEAGFHTGVLRQRPDMRVVLHFQTPFATTLCCRQTLPAFHVLPEIPYYIGDVAVVPYVQPGTPALAEKVISALATHDLAVLRSHGQVVVGTTIDDAIQKAVFFELACGVIVRGGSDVQPLPADAVSALREAAAQSRGA